MSIEEKLKKIKDRSKAFELPENEKTGVINGLLILGAAIGTFLSLQKTTSGTDTPTQCTDTTNQKVTETDIPTTGREVAFDLQSWDDHCWWDHCWWDHTWHNFTLTPPPSGG